MTWTIRDSIDLARDHVQDVREGNYRHSDEKMIRYFNSAISDARRIRPDLFLPTLIVPPAMYTVADLADPSTEFPIDGMYFTAIAEYIAGTIGLGDDEFAVDGRAVALLNRFTQKLTSRGA